MALSEILKERGYVNQHSSKTLEEITDGQKRTLYLGIDPSADSLHVGQVMSFLILRRFLEDGHKVVLVIGGGTGMIGDPGGKNVERPLLDEGTVRKNAETIGNQAKHLFGSTDPIRDGASNGAGFTMVNNTEWLGELKLIDFLRDVGKHFTVNTMLQRDFVKDRVKNADEGISYTEFSYALLQSYDYLHLHQKYDCDLQVGGSDQWGNIVSGVDFIRRKTGDTVYALTWPLLINKSTGKKFGKSESGTIWLDAAKTPPFRFYQFWINVADDDVEDYLLKMTMLSKVEIDAALELSRRDKKERQAQQILAHEITALVHGEQAANTAKAVSEILFGDRGLIDLDADTLTMLLSDAPSCEVQRGESVLEVLVRSNLASSKREARQLLSGRAISLNSEPIDEPERALEESDFTHGVALLRRAGRTVSVLKL